MSIIRLIILLLFTVQVSWCSAQRNSARYVLPDDEDILLSRRGLHFGDTIYIMLDNCKSTGVLLFERQRPVVIPVASAVKQSVPARVPFLKVHGNILYNFSYRSYIDTPFAQQDLQQHLIQTWMDFVVKDKYPVRLTVTHRNSNSPYFINSTDVNLQFNRQQLLNNIKTDLRNKAGKYINTEYLTKAEQLYANRQQAGQQLQNWLKSPARVQEMVEEKERALRNMTPSLPSASVPGAMNGLPGKGLEELNTPQFPGRDGIGIKNNNWGRWQQKATDSLRKLAKDTLAALAKQKANGKDSTYRQKYEQKKKELDSLQAVLKADYAKVKQEKKKAQDSLNKIKTEINSLNTTSGLYAFMKKHGIARSELTKAQRVLLAINQIGIGRSWVDYSELTVKNVSLAGVNIEMNPLPFYFAAAAGKVNYRFRDFILKNNKEIPNQPLYLIRAGVGQKEKNNFIVTFYNGKKAILNYSASNTPASVQRVLGISAEARFALDANNYVIAEVAKSSYNHTAGTQPSSNELVKRAFNFRTNSNMAYSIRLFGAYPHTDTRVTAYYKSIGEDFQSFNLNPINVNQDAWMLKVNQYFWKRKLSVDASIRKNDFNSPIAAPSFSTKTVFKSFQASLRIPKYPFVSVGYYPTSQLSLLNNNTLIENQYNTLNVAVSHSYQLRKTGMNTNAVYTKFFNSSSDTGFIYYNASSWTINHSFFLAPFVLQTSFSKIDQKDLDLFSLEQSVSYQYKGLLTLSGSLKWNRVNNAESLFGGTAAMGIFVKKLGTLQLNYDKTYLPAYNRLLMPVDMGRLSFYREF